MALTSVVRVPHLMADAYPAEYVVRGTFSRGATLQPNEANGVLQDADGQYYRYTGTFPVTVPEGSSPTTGWVSVGYLRVEPTPAVGTSLVSNKLYFFDGHPHAVVGSVGTVTAVNGRALTTTTGTAYLVDKRWPVTDLRAWGAVDGVQADDIFKNAVTYLCRAPGTVRSLYVPPIGMYLTSVELRDMSNFNIHFDGTYVLGAATTPKTAMISVVNAVFFSITGNPIMESTANNYTYALELKGGLPSLIAPLTGLLSNVCSDTIRFRRFPCAIRVGDGSDLQISEIQLNAQTNRCNCVCEVNGSQAIVTVNGSLLCEPQPDFTYTKAVFHAIGGIAYQTEGETVSSVDNDGVIAQIRQCSSNLYGNPFGSVKVSGTHVECAGLLMAVDNGSGIVGPSDSTYSCVSFSNCQGSMLNGAGELVAVRVDPYSGRFAVDSTCNFYTSATRTAKIVYSVSPTFKFDVAPGAFGKGFGTLSSEIGSGNVDWKHGLQPIMYLHLNPIGVSGNSTAPISFSSRESTGDYQFYYNDTSFGGIVLTHSLDSMNVSIQVLSDSMLLIRVFVNNAEFFACQGGGTVTLPRNLCVAGTVIEFKATNGTGSTSTISASSRIIVSGSNRD